MRTTISSRTAAALAKRRKRLAGALWRGMLAGGSRDLGAARKRVETQEQMWRCDRVIGYLRHRMARQQQPACAKAAGRLTRDP